MNNLQIFYVNLASGKLENHFASVIRSFAEASISRVKHTSLEISNNWDYGLLNVFSNTLVVLYISFDEDVEMKEENKQGNPKKSKEIIIQSSSKYYDFQVRSSLLIIDKGKEGEFIWHLDGNHNIIWSPIIRSQTVIEVVSSDDNIVKRDKSIIDVNYYNKSSIALLHDNGVSFLNIKDQTVTNKVETPGITLINLVPLYGGYCEDQTSLLGLSSQGEWVKYSLKLAQNEVSVSQIEQITDSQTKATTIWASAINRNRNLVFMGTSFGASQLSSFSKGENVQALIYKFQENYGNMKSLWMYNNDLTFSYGNNFSKTDSIESSSNRLATSWDLNKVLAEIKDEKVNFNWFRFCNVTQELKDFLSTQNINVNLNKDVILFFSSTNETFVLKMDMEDYHMEAIQILDFSCWEAYIFQNYFIFITQTEILKIDFESFINGETNKVVKENLESYIISSSISEGYLAIYTSDNEISFFDMYSQKDKTSFTKAFTYKTEVIISNISLNERILITTERTTDMNFMTKYSLNVYIIEDLNLRFLYSIPIWAEDVNENSGHSLFITDFYFGDNIIQYTYNNTITIQRKGALEAIKKYSSYSISDSVSSYPNV